MAPRTSDGGMDSRKTARDQRFHAPGRDTDTARRTARTFALNACCTPRATSAPSTSTITSSGGLSLEAVEKLPFSDLHVGAPGLRSFNGTPTSARTRVRRRWVADSVQAG